MIVYYALFRIWSAFRELEISELYLGVGLMLELWFLDFSLYGVRKLMESLSCEGKSIYGYCSSHYIICYYINSEGV